MLKIIGAKVAIFMCKYINILLCLFLLLFKVEGNEETAPVVIIADVTWLALFSD